MRSFRILKSYLVLVLFIGCASETDFTGFLANEIQSFGGKTDGLRVAELSGRWTIKRDPLGAAIDTDGIHFEAVTNALTAAYGEPQFYSPANERHGPTYVYSSRTAGISIFVSSTKKGAEITLTKFPD